MLSVTQRLLHINKSQMIIFKKPVLGRLFFHCRYITLLSQQVVLISHSQESSGLLRGLVSVSPTPLSGADEHSCWPRLAAAAH